MVKETQAFKDARKRFIATITNLRKAKTELDTLKKKGKVKRSLYRKLKLAETDIVDGTLLLMEENEGVNELIEKVDRIADEVRLEAWRAIGRAKTDDIKAELFSLWYGDRELEKEFNVAKSLIDDAESKVTKDGIGDAIRDYDRGIDKLASVYMELTKVKQRSSIKNLAKFIVWGVPFVFAIAQFLAFGNVVIMGYRIPWYAPLIALVVGCFVVWGWVRSRRNTKENILIAFVVFLVWAGIVTGFVFLVQFVSGYFTLDPAGVALLIIVIYSAVALIVGIASPEFRRLVTTRNRHAD